MKTRNFGEACMFCSAYLHLLKIAIQAVTLEVRIKRRSPDAEERKAYAEAGGLLIDEIHSLTNGDAVC